MIQILYFASLRERLDRAEEQIPLPDSVATAGDLAAFLGARGGVWEEVFNGSQTVMTAVNQAAGNAATALQDGDEVAFYPPVTGG